MRLVLALLALLAVSPALAQTEPVTAERVTFPSRDGRTEIVGYFFKSAAAPARAPGIVMLHGRSGAYSSRARGNYSAETLSARHKAWAHFWARAGYVALMVDDYGPVGYPSGFKAGTYGERPAVVNEVVNRPLHAYGALRYLQLRPDVDARRIGLMGWSNGGSATLAAMADDKPGDMRRIGFRAAVSLYPGCGLKRRFAKDGYRPYAPVRVFMGSVDEEVSPELCESFVGRSRQLGGDIALTMFPGATHSYDTPIRSRQRVAANAAAKAETERQALAFFEEQLRVDEEAAQ